MSKAPSIRKQPNLMYATVFCGGRLFPGSTLEENMKSSNSDSKSNANFHQIPDNDALGKPPRPTVRSLLDVAGAFLQLGCFSFGGPIAHLGYLRTDFVEPIPS